MPLRTGYGKQSISSNIRELTGKGKTKSKAVAISLEAARRSRKKSTGNNTKTNIRADRLKARRPR